MVASAPARNLGESWRAQCYRAGPG